MKHTDDSDPLEVGAFVGPPLLFLIKADPVVPFIETPTSHLRSALAHVRLSMDLGTLVMDSGGPAVVVRVDVLDAISRRIEAAISILEFSKEVRP